ncbi:uncharacterized protein MONBRDRAFT_10543 [Monosiga brevicollis MX1]|uniref:Uncharacterized protein n=1 Tax=Monosiga brevicollis TaxID=81824 RepID=A9V6P0_MONBE|nr:uncharacterized protein MONBRDRAFT_10543 [Monosiga brevicollis MX1]EDQ86768.1 predicted protein [Monosiga brevicollis MX1]|eukprot:XP_001748313.1 hypothetical protein [Monosiga brevicollis MX1]
MLKSIGRSLRSKKKDRPELKIPASAEVDDELVIETKDRSLTGKHTELGYSGTALGGCASAWTRGFSMEPKAQQHISNVAKAKLPPRAKSTDSLDLDTALFNDDDVDAGADSDSDSGPVSQRRESAFVTEEAVSQAHNRVLADIRARRTEEGLPEEEEEDQGEAARPTMDQRHAHSAVMTELKLAAPRDE